jgi:putative transcriptional regulator
MSKKAFDRIMGGAQEALALAKGAADESKYRIHVPSEVDVKAIRTDLNLTQPEFCSRFGFGLARVRDWEQGRSRPDGALRAYLMVILRQPKAVEKALEPSVNKKLGQRRRAMAGA